MKHEPESLWLYYVYDFKLLLLLLTLTSLLIHSVLVRDSIGQKLKNVVTEGFSFTGKVKEG